LLIGLGSSSVVSALAAGTRAAWAHRARVSLTRVVPNRDAGTWEFITTLHLHDAEVAIATLSGDASAGATSPAGQARLMLELERTMTWSAPDGQTLRPAAEGAEILANDLALYQSLPAPRQAGGYWIEGRFLHAVYAGMVNTVQWDGVRPSRIERLTATRPRASFDWSPDAGSPSATG
jgi:hypothetical protein